MSTVHDARIDDLTARYAGLVEHVEALAFPLRRTGAAAPPDMSNWSPRRRLFFRISSPLLTTFSAGTFDELVDFLYKFLIVGTIWLYALLTWTASAAVFLDHIFGDTLSPPTAGVEVAVWGIVLLGIGNSLFPLAYLRWIAFWRDQRYSHRSRRILTLLFLICVTLAVTWLITTNPFAFRRYVLTDVTDLAVFVGTCLVFIIPILTFFYMLVVDTTALGFWLLSITLRYFWSLHNPLPQTFIRELATQPITWNHTPHRWRLADLSQAELQYLREWAHANRDATDKRLLPTALLLTALGLFVGVPPFSAKLSAGVMRLFDAMTSRAGAGAEIFSAIGAGVIFWCGVVLVLAFLYVIMLLFRNLATQSLIIEACIVCEYATRQEKRTTSKTNGLLGRLLQ